MRRISSSSGELTFGGAVAAAVVAVAAAGWEGVVAPADEAAAVGGCDAEDKVEAVCSLVLELELVLVESGRHGSRSGTV